MSSRLIKGPGFGRSVPHRMQLPYPKEEIAAVVTVILKRENTVEVMGNVGNLEFGQLLLQAGKERLEQWHKQVAEAKAAKEQASGLVTADGVPVEELTPSSVLSPEGLAFYGDSGAVPQKFAEIGVKVNDHDGATVEEASPEDRQFIIDVLRQLEALKRKLKALLDK